MKTENLEVFKLSHETVLDIYRETKDFPTEERFGLVSQMRRSSASIPMNIMEGAGRAGTKDKYDKLHEKCQSISRMLYRLSESLKKKSNQ